MAENTIVLINKTDPAYANLRIAVYQKDAARPNQDNVAWVVADPAPSGGMATITVPDTYESYLTYDVPAVRYQSNSVFWNSYSAYMKTVPTVDDKSGQITVGLALVSEGLQAPVQNHVQVDVPSGLGHDVTANVLKDGKLVVPSIQVSPGETGDFEVTPTFYLARVDQATPQGALLKAATLSTSETPIKPGQRCVISGNPQIGFKFDVSDQD